MCVTRVRTYVYPDGRKDVIETPEYCGRSAGNRPCKNHRRREYPEQLIASSSSAMGSPSLVDDVTTPSSGSFPPTPVSATSGPRLELRQPTSGSSKGKEKVRRSIHLSDLRIDLGKSRKESSTRRPEERTNRARFADEESESTIRPETPTRRGRGDQPSPSTLRSTAPTNLGSPLQPRARRTPTEVHQPNPPSSSRFEAPRLRQPTPGLHRRTNTEPVDISRPSSTGATVGGDADILARADARAQAREENQRQERERRRLEEDRERRRLEDDRERRQLEEERIRRFQRRQQEETDRRLAEELDSELNLNAQRLARQAAANENRERAEDEFSLREYERINDREAIRESHRKRLAEEERLRRIREQLREREEEARADRIARQVFESRERRADAVRREVEEDIRGPSDNHRHEEQRRREIRLQESIAQMARQNEESELTAIQREIQRLTNEIQYGREARRQRERHDELAAEFRRVDELQEEIAILEALQTRSNEVAIASDEVARAERELRDFDRIRSQRSSLVGSPSRYPPAGYIGAAAPYTSPTTPTSLSGGRPSSGGSGSAALQTRSPYEDPNYRRLRGEQVLRQERGIASARDSALELQRAISDEDVDMSRGLGLGRRNTIGGGARGRETAYRGQRRYYPQ